MTGHADPHSVNISLVGHRGGQLERAMHLPFLFTKPLLQKQPGTHSVEEQIGLGSSQVGSHSCEVPHLENSSFRGHRGLGGGKGEGVGLGKGGAGLGGGLG